VPEAVAGEGGVDIEGLNVGAGEVEHGEAGGLVLGLLGEKGEVSRTDENVLASGKGVMVFVGTPGAVDVEGMGERLGRRQGGFGVLRGRRLGGQVGTVLRLLGCRSSCDVGLLDGTGEGSSGIVGWGEEPPSWNLLDEAPSVLAGAGLDGGGDVSSVQSDPGGGRDHEQVGVAKEGLGIAIEGNGAPSVDPEGRGDRRKAESPGPGVGEAGGLDAVLGAGMSAEELFAAGEDPGLVEGMEGTGGAFEVGGVVVVEGVESGGGGAIAIEGGEGEASDEIGHGARSGGRDLVPGLGTVGGPGWIEGDDSEEGLLGEAKSGHGDGHGEDGSGIAGDGGEDEPGGDPLAMVLGRGGAKERGHGKNSKARPAFGDEEGDSDDEGENEEILADGHEKKTETGEDTGVWNEGGGVEGGSEVVDLGLWEAEGEKSDQKGAG